MNKTKIRLKHLFQILIQYHIGMESYRKTFLYLGAGTEYPFFPL
jgi:hypothetical protein